MVITGCPIVGCDRADSTPVSAQFDDVVRTTSAPVDALARQIVGELVQVELLCPPTVDPAMWRPTPETVARYQRSRLIVSNGAGYEKWVQTAPLPRSRLIEAAGNLSSPLITVQGETHSHGPEGHHSHEVTLGQVWLDPLLAIEQAQAITAGLSDAFPEHADSFRENLDSLNEELIDLHSRLERIDTSGIEVLAPSTPYAYIARRYAWQAIELSPSPDEWTMDLYSLRVASGNAESRPQILLCTQIPDAAVVNNLLESHGVHLIQWPVYPKGSPSRFSNLFSESTKQLELLTHQLKQ